MKIAIINTTAKTGSTGKIAFGLLQRLQNDGHDVRIYYGRVDRLENDQIRRVVSPIGSIVHMFLARITGLHGYFSTRATKRAIYELTQWKPDLIQLYNLHGYYLNINLFLQWVGKSGIPTVYSMLDEFPYLGRCCYSYDCDEFRTGCKKCRIGKHEYPNTLIFRHGRKFYQDKSKAYNTLNRVLFVGPQYVVERAKCSGLLKEKRFGMVDEYVDTDHLFFPKKEYRYIPREYIEEKRIIILTVADYSNSRKGGKYFLKLAELMKEQTDYLFIYVGINADVDVSPNCLKRPFVSNQDELAEYYSIADIFVCTSMADTMPNVCLEALACGTPILGFDNTGMPYVAEEPYGTFVENKNTVAMKEVLLKTKKKSPEMVMACRGYALKRYSPEAYYQKMKSVYEAIKKDQYSDYESKR